MKQEHQRLEPLETLDYIGQKTKGPLDLKIKYITSTQMNIEVIFGRRQTISLYIDYIRHITLYNI